MYGFPIGALLFSIRLNCPAEVWVPGWFLFNDHSFLPFFMIEAVLLISLLNFFNLFFLQCTLYFAARTHTTENGSRINGGGAIELQRPD